MKWYYLFIPEHQRRTVEDWELISNLIPHFMGRVITCPGLDLS